MFDFAFVDESGSSHKEAFKLKNTQGFEIRCNDRRFDEWFALFCDAQPKKWLIKFVSLQDFFVLGTRILDN